MIRAILPCLLIAGCASANMRDTVAHGDLDRHGCIAYRCQMYCADTATDKQRKAFAAGVIDDAEREALRRLAWGIGGDTATTIAALSLCEAARELNPVLGPSPSPFAVMLYNGIAYAVSYQDAKRSPAWCSSARPINTAAAVRGVVILTNAAVIVGCR